MPGRLPLNEISNELVFDLMDNNPTIRLSEIDAAQILNELLEHRAELTARLDAIKNDIARTPDKDSAERASELENSEVLSQLKREASQELGKVTAALTRLYAGRYGDCMECGEAIQPQRLLAYPSASHCIVCKRRQETLKSGKIHRT